MTTSGILDRVEGAAPTSPTYTSTLPEADKIHRMVCQLRNLAEGMKGLWAHDRIMDILTEAGYYSDDEPTT